MMRNYFSPPPAGWVRDQTKLRAIRTNFEGLCKAVDAKVCKPSRAEADAMDIVDAFKTKKVLHLNFDVQTRICGEQQAVLFRMSPQPGSHPVWKSLDTAAAAFRCSP